MIQKNTKLIKINFIFKFNKKKIYIYYKCTQKTLSKELMQLKKNTV